MTSFHWVLVMVHYPGSLQLMNPGNNWGSRINQVPLITAQTRRVPVISRVIIPGCRGYNPSYPIVRGHL